MSPKLSNSDSSSYANPDASSEQTAPDPEVVVVAVDGSHLEAAIDGQMFYCSLAGIHGRRAARAFAYSLGGEDPKTARAILAAVGKEG